MGSWAGQNSCLRNTLLITYTTHMNLSITRVSKIMEWSEGTWLKPVFCISVQFRGQYWTESTMKHNETKLRFNWLVCTVMSKWLEEISESAEPMLLISLTLCIDLLRDALTHSWISAASASSLVFFFSVRFCLDRPAVFLLTLSSIMNILVARRSWTRAFVVVNSSWQSSWTR